MTKVLEGVRVIELSTIITAPLAGMMLADLGADVLKVEPPGGDPFRYFRGESYSPNFIAFNRGKKSMQLDLRTAAGREILLKLAARADVVRRRAPVGHHAGSAGRVAVRVVAAGHRHGGEGQALAHDRPPAGERRREVLALAVRRGDEQGRAHPRPVRRMRRPGRGTGSG